MVTQRYNRTPENSRGILTLSPLRKVTPDTGINKFTPRSVFDTLESGGGQRPCFEKKRWYTRDIEGRTGHKQRIVEYQRESGKDLMGEVFRRITKEQCLEFGVSGCTTTGMIRANIEEKRSGSSGDGYGACG
jgi:hypothetical protein